MIVPGDTTVCEGDVVQYRAELPPIPFTASTSAGNFHRGAMFDLQAMQDITILHFDILPVSGTDVEIYYKTGTHVGAERDPNAWTLVGRANNVIPSTGNGLTRVPLNINLNVSAGQSVAFYVTSATTGGPALRYSNGNSFGGIYASNNHLRVRQGSGLEYPFGNGQTIFRPRIWNGRINYRVRGQFQWSNGDTSEVTSVLATSSQMLRVNVSVPGGQCMASDSVQLTVNPRPAVQLGQDTTICQGESLLLNGGQPNSQGLSFLWGNGGTTPVYQASNTENVTLAVTNTFGCTGTDTMNLQVNPIPTVDFGPDTLVCRGDSLLLDPGYPNMQHLWQNGGNAKRITLTSTPGTPIICQVTDAAGCTDSDTIEVEFHGPTVDLGPDRSFCDGKTITLNAGNDPFCSYLWSDGSTTQSLTVGQAGPWSVQVVDSFGCQASDMVNLTKAFPPSAKFNYSQNGMTCQMNNQTTGASTYFWDFGDGNTDSTFSPIHTFNGNGPYEITLIATNMCGADTFVTWFLSTSLADHQTRPLQVWPNPSQGQFQLAGFLIHAGEIRISVSSLQGKNLYSTLLSRPSGDWQTEIRLPETASGLYLLTVQTSSGIQTHKLTIKN